MRELKVSGTRPITWLMIDATDHLTGKTGLTPTVVISKDGAAFGSPAGTVAEVGLGVYKLTPTSADTGTLGVLWLHATATGADVEDERYQVVAYDPEIGTNLGLSALPTASPAANGGLPTVNGSNQVAGVSGNVVGSVASVTAGVTVTTNNDKTGYTASTVSDKTGYSLAASQTFNVTGNITGNVSGSVGSVTGNVGGNVVGSVASVGSAVTLTTSERNSVADALLDRADGIEVGLAPRQAFRLLAAALAGKLAGAGTTTVTIRSAVADDKTRITATVDTEGDRSAITYDLT